MLYISTDVAVYTGAPSISSINPTSASIGTSGSIPVPLGYVNWGFCGDAINTVPSQNTASQQWLLNCGGPTPDAPTVQSSSSYPPWTTTKTNQL